MPEFKLALPRFLLFHQGACCRLLRDQWRWWYRCFGFQLFRSKVKLVQNGLCFAASSNGGIGNGGEVGDVVILFGLGKLVQE